METDLPPNNPIVFFDGDCNFCNSSVNFILRWESNTDLMFCPIQSHFATTYLKGLASSGSLPDSIVLMIDGNILVRSDAALAIAGNLKYPFKLFKYGRFVPKKLRDFVYDWIAQNRYRWFGKRNECMMPSNALKSRFIV